MTGRCIFHLDIWSRYSYLKTLPCNYNSEFSIVEQSSILWFSIHWRFKRSSSLCCVSQTYLDGMDSQRFFLVHYLLFYAGRSKLVIWDFYLKGLKINHVKYLMGHQWRSSCMHGKILACMYLTAFECSVCIKEIVYYGMQSCMEE